MRIVLIGPAYPLRGGIAHYVAALYSHLSQRGHQVRVLSFRRQYPSIFFPGKTQKDEGEELIPVSSTPLLDSINPFSWLRAFFWLRRLRPEVILFKYWMPFFAPCYAAISWPARKFLGVRVIYICDNIVPHEKKPGDSFLTWLGLRFVDAFIVQSASVREDLMRLKPGAEFRETPHPVYDIFPPALPKSEARGLLGIEGKEVILYFGYIRAYKGLPCLIKAMPYIWQERRVRLLVCGEFYEGREEALALIRDLDREGLISLYDDFIPNQDVTLYFSAADLVVLPYRTATQSGIVQIAYHYEKPVVVTAVGGLPETVPHGKTGYVVEPDNPREVARAVLSFFRSKKRDGFTANIRREKKKYSWERMCETVEELAAVQTPNT